MSTITSEITNATKSWYQLFSRLRISLPCHLELLQFHSAISPLADTMACLYTCLHAPSTYSSRNKIFQPSHTELTNTSKSWPHFFLLNYCSSKSSRITTIPQCNVMSVQLSTLHSALIPASTQYSSLQRLCNQLSSISEENQ